MKKPGFYTSGEFARMAHVTIRTIRYYDKQKLLMPSKVDENGRRYYTDGDLARLQQILLFKYLGFSLQDIQEMTVQDINSEMLRSSLNMQLKLVRDRAEQLRLVEEAVKETVSMLDSGQEIDFGRMLSLIHLTTMESSLRSQYLNASNVSARINLHRMFSVNQQGWFPFVYEQCRIVPGMSILELGCGNGALWTENEDKVPEDIRVILSDSSEGMLRDARREVGREECGFSYQTIDAHQIPYPDNSFDLVIASHVLFYCEDIGKALGEISRVLKPDSRLISSTYGEDHMKEISMLVSEFDSRIALAARNLYERFGLGNGMEYLGVYFATTEKILYQDHLLVDRDEPLVEYILSCHGNQNQYILERFKEFKAFVSRKTGRGLRITKEAGVFISTKKSL